MLILTTSALLLLAATPSSIPPVVVECPVGVETRIVFPEAAVELRTPPGPMTLALGLRVAEAAPRAVIVLTPRTHPLEALLGFEGPTAKLRVQIRTIAAGKSQEVRLPAPGEEKPPAAEVATAAMARIGESSPARAEAPPKNERPSSAARLSPSTGADGRRTAERRPEQQKGKGAEKAKAKREQQWETLYEETEVVPPPASPGAPAESPEEVVVLRPVWVAAPDPLPGTPAAAEAARPVPSPSPRPPAGIEPISASFDVRALALARPQRIGREEGLPGQRVTVLEDALKGSALVWLRFRIRGGAKSHVDGVRWNQGEIKSVLIEPDGQDLRVVVQLPRTGVTKSTRVELRIDGTAYKFGVSAPWFSSFLRSLF